MDNLVEKVDECSLNWGVKYCLRTIGTTKAIQYTTLQGCLSIEVNGRTVGTFRNLQYIIGVHC